MRSLLIAILIFICASCTTTKYVDRPVPVETVRTEYVNKVETKYDSIFVRDSIDRYIKGDTVFIEKYRDRYKYKDRVVTDTIVKTDSIEVPVEIKTTEVKEVNKIKGYQSFLMYFGLGFILILLYKAIKFGRTIFNKSN